MLKCEILASILVPPDDPDGGVALYEEDGELKGAGWRVPIVGGIPDFVCNAPSSVREIQFSIPIQRRPSDELLRPPAPAGKPPDWFQEERSKYAILAAHRKGLLLDAGCGQGFREMYERMTYSYIGLDSSFNSQQRTSGPADLDIVADCHRLPFRRDTFEVVNSAAVIEHLYCPPLFVRQACRVLKPGGILVGSCSFLESEHFESQCHHTHLGLFRLLEEGGLRVENIYPGLSMWEMHADSIYFGVPGCRFLGRLHRRLYLWLVGLKSKEKPYSRLMRHAALFHFIASKP